MRHPSIAAIAALALAALLGLPAHAADPIRIGFSMAQTGPLAANGKSALLAMEIWRDDINAKGGLLGRPVEFVDYDDQSNPSTVPGIYTKLLEVDKVDLVVSGYATNLIAPAMPVVIQHNMTFLSLFGLAVNGQFHYPKYFTITPTGPDADRIGRMRRKPQQRGDGDGQNGGDRMAMHRVPPRILRCRNRDSAAAGSTCNFPQ